MHPKHLSRRGLIGLTGAATVLGAVPLYAQASRPAAAKLFLTEAGTGRNVMLIHGWTADSHDWSWQLPTFEKRYRTIAVDLRGHGRSEVMPSGGYRPADYVADLVDLITTRYRDQRFVLIGHSMGGQIAARIAVEAPDLVEAVVSIDGSLGFPVELESVFRKASDDLKSGDPGAAAPALFDTVYDAATAPALKRWHSRRVQGMAPHVVRESFGPLFLGTDQVGIGAQSAAFCKRLDVPIYHLCRSESQADEMRGWFQNARSTVDAWAHAGHWIMQDRPDDVNAAVIGWIDSL